VISYIFIAFSIFSYVIYLVTEVEAQIYVSLYACLLVFQIHFWLDFHVSLSGANDDSAVPTQEAPPPQPVTLMNMGLNQTLVPGEEYIATQQHRASSRQTQPRMQGTMPWAYGCIGQDSGRLRGESCPCCTNQE
jgi:hypothetical protein